MSLLTDLVSVWEMDEASGNAVDAHGSNTLAAANSPGATTGVIAGARSLVAASIQTFSTSSVATLVVGDIDFTFCAWVKLASKASDGTILSKWTPATTNRSYWLLYQSSSDRFRFSVSSNGSASAAVNWSSAPSTGVWYWVVGWHDSGSNQIAISVNNGTAVTLAHSAGVFADSGNFVIGGIINSPAFLIDGEVDQILFYKRLLTSGEMASLYNGGSGLAYASFGGGAFKPYWARRTSQVLGGR